MKIYIHIFWIHERKTHIPVHGNNVQKKKNEKINLATAQLIGGAYMCGPWGGEGYSYEELPT